VEVDDADDPRLDLYRDLKDPAARTSREADHSVVTVEGRLTVERLLMSPYRIRSLLVDDHQVTAAADLVAATPARGAPVYVGTRSVVAATVGFALHRGVVALAARPPPARADGLLVEAARPAVGSGRIGVVAVLEGLNDHQNIGALFRNAAAFGVAGVLLDPTCADPLYRRSVRVSVGHVLHVPFARLAPWPGALAQVRAAGFLLAALTPRPSEVDGPVVGLSELRRQATGGREPARGVALLLGAEGPGLSAAALNASDVSAHIPMAGGVDSLNVATAAAIAFHALAGA
jgi:tRNA G18 (ribose-2'-O)-methylase SpoU